MNKTAIETVTVVIVLSVSRSPCPASGTGIVKVTPCHDARDYECGLRHDLPMEVLFDEAGYMVSGRRVAVSCVVEIFWHFHFLYLFNFIW